MANKTIPELSAAVSLNLTDEFPVSQSGNPAVKGTVTQLQTVLLDGVAGVSPSNTGDTVGTSGYYGNANAPVLCSPDAWLRVTVGGVVYSVPCFTPA